MTGCAVPRAVTARRALTMLPGAAPIEDAALVLWGRRVLAVGPRRSVLAGFSGPVDALGAVTLLPGLVNAHVHLELSHLRGQGPRGQGFVPWAAWLARAGRAAAPEGAVERAVAEAAASGCGAVIDVGGRAGPEVVRALAAAGLTGLVCQETFGFRSRGAVRPAPALAAAGGEAVRIGISGHALYSTSPDRLRQAKQWCRARGLPFCLHLAEPPEEVALLADGSGGLADLLGGRVLPRPYQPPGRSPVAEAQAQGLLGPDTLAVHGVWLTPADRAILADTGTAVCLCPRSNAAIGVGRADAPAALAAGIPLCLGTDSLASNDDLDLWNEVRRLLADHPDFPPWAVLPALTVVPARMLGRSGALGRLAPGAVGGYAVVPADLEPLLLAGPLGRGGAH